MSNTKPERVRQLITSIVSANKRFIYSFAGGQPGLRKQVDFRLGNGAQVRLTFTDVNSLFAALSADDTSAEGGEWMGYRLRIDGETKVEAHFRGNELELDAYTPGAWEWSLGLAHQDDREVLLPVQLRKRA